MAHKKPTIKIKEKTYDLKVTLGFWKNLSFKKSESETLGDNPERIVECLRLAIFYGNKKSCGWSSLADMDSIISKEDLEDLEVDPIFLLNDAFYYYLPDNLKKATDELEKEESRNEKLKKK